MTTGSQGTTSSSDTAFLGHPRGLAVLFFAEMWERFSYYGMRALLVTYLIWHFLQSESEAYGIYAAYAGMIYLAPVLGGYMADRYLGSRKAVAFGAVLITLGHFAMAYEGSPGYETLAVGDETYRIESIKNPEGDRPQFVRQIVVGSNTFLLDQFATAPDAGDDAYQVTYTAADGGTVILNGTLSKSRDGTGMDMMFLALALIIVGTGFLKANISAVVGALYEMQDRRRDSGFTLFYFGINLGAFLGQLLVALLGIAYGWSYGFGLAGFGMLLGLVTFMAGSHWLEGRGDPPNPEELAKPVFGPLNREWIIYLFGTLSVALVWLIVKYMGQIGVADILQSMGLRPESIPVIGEFTLFDLVVNVVFIACFVGISVFSINSLEKIERDRMMALLVLTLSSVIFWTLFDQAPISLVIFQTKFVDTWILNPQQVGLLNPLFILMFAALFSYLWYVLGQKDKEPASPFKFALGLFQIGAGFLVLSLGITLEGDDLIIGLHWVALMFLLHTTGELCLSPIGLSAVTKLSIQRLVGFMMGIWFMAIALAQVGASIVSKATVVPDGTDPAIALAQYNTVYFWLGVSSVGVAFLMALASGRLKAMMHGRH